MATYSKSSGVGGAWVDKAKVVNGTKVKIITESVPTEEMFEGKMRTRNVVKLRFQGDEEPKNFDLNKPTINGLIEAFGEDSKSWMGQMLAAHTEKVIVGGRRGTSMYLIPEGFELTEDAGGYVVIQRIGAAPVAPAAAAITAAAAPEEEGEEEINPEDIPF